MAFVPARKSLLKHSFNRSSAVPAWHSYHRDEMMSPNLGGTGQNEKEIGRKSNKEEETQNLMSSSHKPVS